MTKRLSPDKIQAAGMMFLVSLVKRSYITAIREVTVTFGKTVDFLEGITCTYISSETCHFLLILLS